MGDLSFSTVEKSLPIAGSLINNCKPLIGDYVKILLFNSYGIWLIEKLI